MFSTFDSGISQINTFNVTNWQTPQISKSVDSENTIPIKIRTPKVKESFKNDGSMNVYQQPLLSVYTPHIDNFSTFSFSSLSNAPLLQSNEKFDNSLAKNSSLVPFFGPRLTQDMSGTNMPNDYRPNSLSRVSRFTGVNDFTFERRVDTPDYFFTPKESKEKFILTSSGKGTEATCMMNVDLDRYKMDLTRKDDCFDRINVGRSLQPDPNVPASDGFQSFYRYINDDKLPRYSDGTQMLENLKVMDVPTFTLLPKPDTSVMPQENTLSTKPRIYDGAMDLKESRFFVPPEGNSNDLTRASNERDPSPEYKLTVQNDIENSRLSASFVTQRDVLQKSNTEPFTNEFNVKKQSLSIPLVTGKALNHPYNILDSENTKLSKCREHETDFSSIGKKSIVSSNEDVSFEQERNNERTSGSSLFINAIPKTNKDLRPKSYPTKKRNITVDPFDFQYHSVVNTNLQSYPQQNSTKTKNKEILNQKHSDIKKVVRFKIDENVKQDIVLKQKKTNYISNQHPFDDFQKQVYENNGRIDCESLQDELKLVEFEKEWPKILLPKNNVSIDFPLELRKTKRNSLKRVSTTDIGVKKGTRTMGESVDILGVQNENISLKKAQKLWPASNAGSSTHIAAPLETRTNENTRPVKRITDHDYNTQQYLPERVFPNEHVKITTKKKVQTEMRAPNPSVIHTNNDAQRTFYSSFTSNNKHTDSSFTHQPTPHKALLSVNTENIGVQSNIRV